LSKSLIHLLTSLAMRGGRGGKRRGGERRKDKKKKKTSKVAMAFF